MGIVDANIGRRGFLKATAAAALATSVLKLGRANAAEESGASADGDMVASDAAILRDEGQWYPIHCHQNCGGICRNWAYVVDGVCMRQKTDDTHEDSVEAPQKRGCLRGRSSQQEVYNVDRLKYPMKRKHWQPGGGENSHGELRGKDEWERITWDEALDYVADELKRVYADYGPRSVIANGWRWTNTTNEILKAMGGYIMDGEAESYGCYSYMPQYLGTQLFGDFPNGRSGNSKWDLMNSEYIVLYGYNPAWGDFAANYSYTLAREAGAQFVVVGPARNVSAAALGARWIPVRPGTDTAFLLAVMYEMLRLDEEQGDIIDWDFLNRYTVGFDLGHMPEDAQLNECISEYVKGVYDGTPKTPEWASEICGTPVEDITWFAEAMGKNHDVAWLHNYAHSRCSGAENVPQASLTVACMGAHLGRRGNQYTAAFAAGGDPGSSMFIFPSAPDRARKAENPLGPTALIEGPQWWKALLDGKYVNTCTGVLENNHFEDFREAVEMECDPRIMFAVCSNFMQTRQDLNDAIKVMRKAEMCVSIDIKPTLTAMFADVILPIPSDWEYNMDETKGELIFPSLRGNGLGTKQDSDSIQAWWPCIEPMYDVREELWIDRELCSRLGLDPDELYPVSNIQQYFDYHLGLMYLTPEGVPTPLLSWTAEDSKHYGVDNPPQEGTMTFDEFLELGSFVVPRTQDDPRDTYFYSDYLADPEANPLPSQSGKFELYSQQKADHLNMSGLNPDPIKPYANYIVPVNGYEASFSDWENKVKGDYPLQMYTPHYLRRGHSCYDNLTWTQEAFRNPVFMNASDAAERGIKAGDTVMISSPYGRCLRRAQPLESMMPGTVAVPHGVHSVLDETDPDNIIDRGGSEQILYGPVSSNYYTVVNNYNTNLVEISLYDGDPIPEDYERPPFLIEA